MRCDYHSHILPEMDDGAASAEEALRLIEFLSACDIETICATPHYVPHRESVESFLERRKHSAQLLFAEANKKYKRLPPIMGGAEIWLEKETSLISDISKLCYQDTDYILLELPYANYEPWMAEEIFNISVIHKIKPVIAHLNRYFETFSDDGLRSVVSIRGAVFQMNINCFSDRKAAAMVKSLHSRGYKLVFGSDLHRESSFAEFERDFKNEKKALDKFGIIEYGLLDK